MNDSEEVKEGNEYDYIDWSSTLLDFLPAVHKCVQAIVKMMHLVMVKTK